MKNRAFTLAEQLIVIVILAIIVVIMLNAVKPKNLKTEALQKAAKSVFVQIDFATKNILAKNTNNYTLLRMKDGSGEFSIASSGSLSRLIALYKKVLVGSRKTLNSTYGAKTLTNGSSNLSGLTAAGFTGFNIKNGSYFGVKLHGNCTTTIDYIYA